MKKLKLDNGWKIKECKEHNSSIENIENDEENNWIDASVPGDIHNDLFSAGLIKDPYYSDNFLDCQWVTEKDWTYKKVFTVSDNWAKKNTFLTFDGIDTYSDIYLNKKLICSTDNMFRQYRINVSEHLKTGENEVHVRIKSIKKMAQEYPVKGYFACFNISRIFIRKIQYHFSWDWAPEFPAKGIWKSAYLETYDASFIESMAIRTDIKGNVKFFVFLNGNTYHEDSDVKRSIEILIKDRTGKLIKKEKFDAMGVKNFRNFKIDNPKLWWPQDMGEPYLYNYEICLFENGSVVDCQSGKFGIREVELRQDPKKQENGFTCEILINSKPVFLKGANWVTLDIMTGTITKEKYRKALDFAKKGNYNMLRVWGGGMYENDCFYEMCDELGIMVWQDFPFACSDVPDEFPGFIEKIVPEIERQVKRLRKYTSLVLWCGGNEKTGSFGKAKSRGNLTLHYIARGIVDHLDTTRPYFPSSPWSYSDTGNDHNSGDSHCNSYQLAMSTTGLSNFRDVLKDFTTSMASEIAVQGTPPLSSLKKYIPEEKLWPVNEIWDYHFTRNPYDSTGKTFVQLQKEAAKELFGEFDCVEEFVKKSMTVHSELVKADIEYHRSRRGECSGALLWMFSDVWPCGTWALIDYYLEPKAAYYSSKRAFRTVHPLITKRKEGVFGFIVNDTKEELSVDIEVGQGTAVGKLFNKKILNGIVCPGLQSKQVYAFDNISSGADYLYIKMFVDNEVVYNTYFHNLWKNVDWKEPEIKWTLSNREKSNTIIEISSDVYARMVRVIVEKDIDVTFSDNYFDLMPEETKRVIIESDSFLTEKDIKIESWSDKWYD